ncbi:MAG: sortase [Clostridia bacterium]|nr:sortase [Clostridia bacterium]
MNSFNIETLYSSENSSYNIIELNNDFSVIGIIEIPKIKIKYPILSNVNDEFLKISACRFYGPYPNKIGNLCIAAHNYDDNRFFGNLYKLNINDEIKIYDSSNNCISYYVYDKFESLINDTSCTSQNTNGKKEITLVTCNNINKKRIIVKAKE